MASVWAYPNGFSKSDIPQHQGLDKDSAVNPGVPHIGQDYGNKPSGFEVVAVADGWVACTYSSNLKGDFGNAVFVESRLPDGKHVTTLYGHLASADLVPIGTTVKRGEHIGKLGAMDQRENGGFSVHLHIGIRDGFVVGWEENWIRGCWGYLFPRDKQHPNCPSDRDEEFIHWHALSDFVERYPASKIVQVWRTQPDKSTGILAWAWTFGVCDISRRIKVYVDDDLIIYTSSQDGPNPSHSQTKWLWPGDHKYKVEVFDYPNTPAVELSWAFAPLGQLQPVPPACSSEPVPPTPTNIPIITSTPEQPVKLFFDDLARDDLDTAINQCFAPQHRLFAKPLLDTYQSAKRDQGLTLKFSNLNYRTVSNDGQKGLVKVTGTAALRDKNGKQYQYGFDVEVPVFTFLDTWYIDLDLQRLQQLLDQMSR